MSISVAEWNITCMKVRDAMASLVWPSVTPISLSVEEGRGHSWGTGNYVHFHGADYVLTNAHVIEQAVGGHLGHLPGPTNDFARLGPDYLVAGWPLDVALTRLVRGFDPGVRVAVPATQFDLSYSAVENELLFVLGFPGSTATRHEPLTDFKTRYTWFGGPMTNAGVPVLTTEFTVCCQTCRVSTPGRTSLFTFPPQRRNSRAAPPRNSRIRRA